MIIRPEAEADLANARDWYERQRIGLGAAFLLCVEEVLERVGRTPEMYMVVYHDVRRALTRRPRTPCTIALWALTWWCWASCIRTVILASGSHGRNPARGTSTAVGKPRDPSTPKSSIHAFATAWRQCAVSRNHAK